MADMLSIATCGWWTTPAVCDYPVIADVRDGVVYDSGALTGTYGAAIGVGGDFEAILLAYLGAQATLTAETGTRIYVDELPEGFTIAKALVLDAASGSDHEIVPASEMFVEFRCYGANPIDAKAVYLALHTVLRAIPSGGVTMSTKKVWWSGKTFGPTRLDDKDTDWPTVQCEYRFRVEE